MSSSLDKLSSNLSKDKSIYTDEVNPHPLLKKKGIYPYSYIDCFSKFEEAELPARECFYNKLNNIDISELEYQHAREVWNTFKIKNLGEYQDLYLKTDVLLLADVFENF